MGWGSFSFPWFTLHQHATGGVGLDVTKRLEVSWVSHHLVHPRMCGQKVGSKESNWQSKSQEGLLR